ncbi:hypothetical protein M514_05146 [Trichuris suis]|uniref:Uncharacterized protein n=1 Tax=Trichuris suis TaxID=68888 RepID=A0A085MZU8_9BILA|nr:hypothetical protein M513_05146 [Trichuris suis]KFD62744.1 hypothetical protein M514_05146 [Trichuris suis]
MVSQKRRNGEAKESSHKTFEVIHLESMLLSSEEKLSHRLGFEEVEHQDVGDVFSRLPDELTTEKLQGKQKEEKSR